MAMHKGLRVLEKSKPPTPHSVLLEYRGKDETLLFESQAVAVLCKYLMYVRCEFLICIYSSCTRN